MVFSLAATDEHTFVGGVAATPVELEDGAITDGPSTFVVALDHAGALSWSQFVVHEPNEYAVVHGLAAMPDGGVVFVGGFSGKIESEGRTLTAVDDPDCMIGRVDAGGRLLWWRALGGAGRQYCRAVVLHADALWVTGAFSGWWTHGFEAESQGSTDVFVVRLDPQTGTAVGGLAWGTTGEDVGRGVAHAPDGGWVAVGTVGGPVSLADRTLSRSLVVGDIRLETEGDGDGFLVAFDQRDEAVWARPFATSGFDVVKDVIRSGDAWLIAGVVQPGHFITRGPGLMGDSPLFGYVAALGPEGKERWRFEDPSLVSANAPTALGDGYVAFSGHARAPLAGMSMSPVSGGTAAVLGVLDRFGVLQRATVCDGAGTDTGQAVATQAGAVLFGGGATPGADCIKGAASDRGFVLRLPWSRASPGR